MPVKPHVAVLSGSLGAGSRTEKLAAWCAHQCRVRGATATLFSGVDLEFPFYRPGPHPPAVHRLLADLAVADSLVLVSPAYHGSLSGLLKNALDYVNELADDDRPFLHGRTVGCVTLAAGGQGGASTLAAMRTIAHALRAWPTPLGVALCGPDGTLGADGAPLGPHGRQQLSVLLDQLGGPAWLSRPQLSSQRNGQPLPGPALPRPREFADPALAAAVGQT